jgi:hypothetical protein
MRSALFVTLAGILSILPPNAGAQEGHPAHPEAGLDVETLKFVLAAAQKAEERRQPAPWLMRPIDGSIPMIGERTRCSRSPVPGCVRTVREPSATIGHYRSRTACATPAMLTDRNT